MVAELLRRASDTKDALVNPNHLHAIKVASYVCGDGVMDREIVEALIDAVFGKD